MKLKLLVWMLAIHNLPVYCTARCLYGNSAGCAFQCHCKDQAECNVPEVTCPGGCTSGILGYDWRGPACQIGNVAFTKSTDGSYGSGDKGPSAAVDGKLQPDCTNYIASNNNLGTWNVDLGYEHRVYNITIHFSVVTCCGLEKLRNYFTVGVNSADSKQSPGVVCITYKNADPAPTTFTVSCPDNTLGRYVYFSRINGDSEPGRVVLCEVIVIGHKHIDCSKCPPGVICSDITGCTECQGSYQPDCKQACDDGFYGTNCLKKCGNCSTNKVCNKISGACPSGCEQWWAPDLCQTYIYKPEPVEKSVTVVSSSQTTLHLEWKQIDFDEEIANFYGYEIRHKIYNDTKFVSNVDIVQHHKGSPTNDVIVRNLQPNTLYEIAIYPYREWNGNKDYGSRYDPVRGKTDCTEPTKPVLISITHVPIVVNVSEKVEVIYQDLLKLSSGCDQLSKAWLKYKLEGSKKEYTVSENLTTTNSSFTPEYGGRYFVWITVENNAGLTSSSDIWNITVIGPSLPVRSKPLLGIMITSLAGVFLANALVIFIIYCVKYLK